MAKAYKLMRVKEGKTYPLYVLAEKETPRGVWLEAEEGERTARNKVKSRLGELAFRPGWHLTDIPYVKHIYSTHNGERYMKDGCYWCEVEYKTDKCYSAEAREEGWRGGRWAASRAYLKRIPVGGYYKYKTNPQMVGEWIICGEMRIIRVMNDEEVERICRENGLEPLKRYKKGDVA